MFLFLIGLKLFLNCSKRFDLKLCNIVLIDQRCTMNKIYLFFQYIRKKVNAEDLELGLVQDKYNDLKLTFIGYQFVFSIVAYIVIVNGYYKAGYYQLMILTLISIFISTLIYIKKKKGSTSPGLMSVLFIYIPIANIFAKDLFFLSINHPGINNFFLHTHFMLLLFIAFGGLVSNRRHILYVGVISVAWIWLFTICINDSYLWSLVVLDTVFFIGITLVIYLAVSCEIWINLKVSKLAKLVGQQNEELNKLIEFKDWMLNIVAHDIKNPINRIVSACKMDIIQKSEIDQPSKQILSMIDNILDMYKMNESKMHLKLTIWDIESVIDKAISNIEYLLCEKKITLVKNVSVKCSLEIDFELMVRVFENMLTNSIKYLNPDGIIEISIDQNENCVSVGVFDNGNGISPDDIDYIFNNYYQARPKNLGITRSTGIGLSFCKSVIESHGGAITVESVLNEGTLFKIELPVISLCEMTHSTTELISNNHNSTIQDDEVLSQYKLSLATISVYETSEILKVFENKPCSSPIVIQWKEELLKSSMTGNVRYFDSLKAVSPD